MAARDIQDQRREKHVRQSQFWVADMGGQECLGQLKVDAQGELELARNVLKWYVR